MKNRIGFPIGIASVLRRYHVGAPRAVCSAFVIASLLALAACAPGPQPGFRDVAVPITATTRFTPEGFAGDWHVIAAYPNAFLPDCPGQTWRAETVTLPARLTVSCTGAVAYDAPVSVNPRGVVTVQTPQLRAADRALWIMWMDEDARTAVIGTPSGEMGWIVNRTPDLRPDRMVAAREIMAFNGYDITQLQEVAR